MSVTEDQLQHDAHGAYGSSVMAYGNPGQKKGFNKTRRDLSKILLGFVTACLLGGETLFAMILSAGAVLCLTEGTMWSTKNLKWISLSAISFGVSLGSLVMQQARNVVDEEKAYTLHVLLWIAAKSLQTCWAATLALFLFSAFKSNSMSLGDDNKHD